MKKLLLVLPLIFLTSFVRAQTEPPTINYTYGVSGSTSGGIYLGVSGSNAMDQLDVMVNRWNVTPGFKNITSFSLVQSIDGTGNTVGSYFVVVKETGGIYTLENSARTSTTTGTGVQRVITYNLSVPVTITAGSTYYYGVALEVPAGHAVNSPGIRATEKMFLQKQYQGWVLSGYVFPSTWSNTLGGAVIAATSVTEDTKRAPYMRITYDSSSYIEYDSTPFGLFSYGISTGTLIPVATGTTTVIKFGDVSWAANDSPKIFFRKTGDQVNIGWVGTATMTFNGSGAGSVTYGNAAVPLSLVDGYTQVSSTFDVMVEYTGGNTKSRLFYLNKSRAAGPQSVGVQKYADLATISHAAASNSAYDRDYTTDPGYIVFIGTSNGMAIRSLQVGVRPLVLMGDSQTGTKASSTSVAEPNLLGDYLPTGFTSDRMWWLAGISGGRAHDTAYGYHSSLMTRYLSTPGTNDLGDMEGVVFAYCGMGVNDTSAPSSDHDRNLRVGRVLAAVSTITAHALSNGNEFYYIGLPPYTDGSAQAKQAQLDINNGLAGLAMAFDIPYANPFYYAFPYTDGSLHYTSAGAALIAPIIARTLENDKAYRVESLVGQTKRYNFNGSAEGQSYRFLP